jgi:hypothetical protein
MFQAHLGCLIVGQDSITGTDSLQAGQSGGGEIFRSHPDRLWCLPSLLYNGCWVSVLGIKLQGHGIDYQPPYSIWVFMACSMVRFTWVVQLCQIQYTDRVASMSFNRKYSLMLMRMLIRNYVSHFILQLYKLCTEHGLSRLQQFLLTAASNMGI